MVPLHLWKWPEKLPLLSSLNPLDLLKSSNVKHKEPPMKTAPRRNRCTIFFHTGFACQKPFEDTVTSRQCTSHRKSSHTRRCRGEIWSSLGLVGKSCPRTLSISLMATKGDHQAALSLHCEGADVGKASSLCNDLRCIVWLYQSANLHFLPPWQRGRGTNGPLWNAFTKELPSQQSKPLLSLFSCD